MLGRPPARSRTATSADEPEPLRKPLTPVYPRTVPVVADPEPEDDVPTVLGRKLAKLLSGGKFYLVGELARELGGVDKLAAAFSNLVGRGRAFDRSGDHVRMRRRADGEAETLVVSLLDGVVVPEVVETAPREEDQPTQDFDPTDDACADEKEEVQAALESSQPAGLVLSDPPDVLVVPYDHVPGSSNTVVARKGMGKTYFAGVLVEELLEMPGGPEVVVVDPLGSWWGLGAAADGTPSERRCLVLGGTHGHLPLRPGDGAAVARLVAGVRPCPVVLDLSRLAPSEQYVFVADFGDATWAGERFPVHVVVDEADEFCPQRFGALSAEQRRSRDAVERWVMRGRTGGYGVTLITLRPAVLSMNARSQTTCMWVLGLAAPQDVAAVAAWMEYAGQGLSEQKLSTCLGQLPVLPRGTAFMVRGGDDPALRRFRVRKKRTFDSSKTDAATARLEAELASPGEAVLSKAREILGGGR